MRLSNASIKKPRLGLFTASTWLTIIVLGESACMVAWIAKEYILFDYKCALPSLASQAESGGLSPRMLYAQHSQAEGSVSRSSRNVSPFQGEAFDDDVYPFDTIASASSHRRFRRDTTIAEGSDSEQTTGEQGQTPVLRILRRRKKKRPTAASDQQPTVESSVAIEPLRILESGVPERPLRTKTTWRKYHPRGVPASAGTVIKRRRLKRPRTSPDLVPTEETAQRTDHEELRADEKAQGSTTESVPLPTEHRDVNTASTVRTYVVEEDDFRASKEPQQVVRRPFEPATYAHPAFEVRTTTTPSVVATIQRAAPPTTTSTAAARRPAIFEKAASLSRPSAGHNFSEQLSTFTSSAVCAARTLAMVWCVLQLAAAVPFVVGIFARLRCLFTAHLVLDALFLVVLFIYRQAQVSVINAGHGPIVLDRVTMTIFSLILFVCVADMSAQTLVEWLLFAAALDVLFVVYTTAFVATLRCCEELLGDQPNSGVRTYRAKSLLYTQIPDADTLTDVNSV